MEVLEYLVHLARQELAPGELLRSAAREIATAVRADSCRIFLRKHGGRLLLKASFGDTSEEARVLPASSLAETAAASSAPATAGEPDGSHLAVPLLSRARCLGAIVVERGRTHPGFLDEEIERLSAIASHLVDLVEGSNLVDLLGEDSSRVEDVLAVEGLPGERILVGTAASPGIATGIVAFRHTFPSERGRHQVAYGGEQLEEERVRDAFQKTQNDLLRMQAAAASELGEEQALIFGAHLLLMRDSMLLARIEQAIREGHSAAVAVEEAFDAIGKRLRSLPDPYIQERIEDVEDLRSRALGHLVETGPAASLRARVVVSPRTSPSVIMELKAQGALGVASELGGTTSHGVLLARALGVPAVTGVSELVQQVNSGDEVIIDGDTGRVILRPTPDTVAEYTRRAIADQRSRSEFARFRDLPARTADDVSFELQANVALGIDLDVAKENGATGVGLYRTEFAFIAREGIPSRDEQVRIYSKAYRAFPDGPISFRILDLAGDKFLSSLGGVARSAFHGYRSIRVLFDYPHILRTQAQAFALAAGGGPLKILVPMVSSVEELRRVKQLVNAAIAQLPVNCAASRVPSFGAMIEVPAAVEITGDLAKEVDFFSIGTNDLIQYALVVDREDSRLSSPRHAFHPAVLRMILRVVSAAHEHGRHVSVCGEVAARPEVAVALLALGVDALSVSARAIPELKHTLAHVHLKPLMAEIGTLIASSDTDFIEQSLRNFLARTGD